MALFLVSNLMMAASIELAPGAPFLQVSRPFEEGVFYLSVVLAGPVRYSLDHLLRNEVGEEEQNPFWISARKPCLFWFNWNRQGFLFGL